MNEMVSVKSKSIYISSSNIIINIAVPSRVNLLEFTFTYTLTSKLDSCFDYFLRFKFKR